MLLSRDKKSESERGEATVKAVGPAARSRLPGAHVQREGGVRQGEYVRKEHVCDGNSGQGVCKGEGSVEDGHENVRK